MKSRFAKAVINASLFLLVFLLICRQYIFLNNPEYETKSDLRNNEISLAGKMIFLSDNEFYLYKISRYAFFGLGVIALVTFIKRSGNK